MINILAEANGLCNSELGFTVFGFLGYIVLFIQIVVPIILIILGTIDLVKLLMNPANEKAKKLKSNLIKKIIIALLIFFVIYIVKFLFGMIGEKDVVDNACFNCFNTPDKCMEKAEQIKNGRSFNVIDEDKQYEYCSSLDEKSCKEEENCVYEYNELLEKNECVIKAEVNWNE